MGALVHIRYQKKNWPCDQILTEWSFLPWCPEGWQLRHKSTKRDDRSDPEWSILCNTFFFFFKFKEDKLSYLVTRSNYKSQMCSEQNLFGKLFSSKTNLCSSDSSPGNLQLEFPILSYYLFHLWAICHDFIVRIIFTSYPHCFYRFVPLLMCLCYDSPTLSIWGIEQNVTCKRLSKGNTIPSW